MRLAPAALLAVLLAATALARDPLVPPRPLERKVEDADLVVVAKLKTKPALIGDVFEVEIDEVLKGAAPAGPLRVRAAVPQGVKLPPPAGVPTPGAVEASAGDDFVTLFLDAPVDGVRASRDPILLRPAERVSSWFLDSLAATKARETIRELARLDTEDDSAKAAELWLEGLGDPDPRGKNALLVDCLAHRVEFAAGPPGAAKRMLGERLAARAAREFAGARVKLLKALRPWAASPDRTRSLVALRAARACLPPADEEERGVFGSLVASEFDSRGPEAIEALRIAFGIDAESALWGFGALLRAQAARPAVVEEIADVARDYVEARPERERPVVESVLPLFDAPKLRDAADTALRRLTGATLQGPEAWRAWLDARSKPTAEAIETVRLDEPWTDARAAAAPDAVAALKRLPIPMDIQSNEILVTPDEAFTLVELAGSGPRLFVLDADLVMAKSFRRMFLVGGDFGIASTGDRVLMLGPGKGEELSIPELKRLRTFDDVDHALPFLTAWGVHPLPAPAAWVVVGWESVARIDAEPFGVGAKGKAALAKPIASAMDDATGLLVMIGDENRVEGFDVATMKSVFTAALPCGQTSYDVAAAGGTAWIGTKDGSGALLEFDLKKRATTRRYELGLPGVVSLAWSAATRELAVADHVFAKTGSTWLLKVLRQEEGRLVPVASLDLRSPRIVNDLAILGRKRTVVLAGSGPTLAWKFGE